MSKKVSNAPSSNVSTGAGGSKKQGGMGMLIGIAVFVLILIIGLVSAFSGGKKKDETADLKNQKIETTASASTGPKQTRVYDQNDRKISKSPMGQPVAAAGQSSGLPGEELGSNGVEYYTDPVTNVKMVHTPSGPVPADSIEGKKFIEDFNAAVALRSANSGNTNPQAASQAVLKEIDSLKSTINSQAQALDEKINSVNEEVEVLKKIIKKQNETIVTLSDQIKNVQPLVKSTKEIAKELFGKNGTKVIDSRNNAVTADSIVGDKAYFTTHDGEVVLVGVGDVIPGTSLIVKEIDPSRNKVIVAH